MMELVISCSALLMFHSFLIRDAYNVEGKYNLVEVLDKDTEGYLILFW